MAGITVFGLTREMFQTTAKWNSFKLIEINKQKLNSNEPTKD